MIFLHVKEKWISFSYIFHLENVKYPPNFLQRNSMKKYLFGTLMIGGLLVLNGCGGGSSSSGKTSKANYANSGFSYENLKGKNFYGLTDEESSWKTSIVKFSKNEQKVYTKEETDEASNESYTINTSLNGCQKGCIDIAIKSQEDNSTTHLYLKALSQDSEKVTILASIDTKDLILQKPKNTLYFFFDKAKLESFKNQNPL